MNEVIIKLQGNKMNLIKAKGIISSFIAKFDIHRVNIGRKELLQFPTLKKCSVSDNETLELPEDKILIFTDHLDQLKTDMEPINPIKLLWFFLYTVIGNHWFCLSNTSTNSLV